MPPINSFFFAVCQGGQLTIPAASAYIELPHEAINAFAGTVFKSYCQGEIKCP
jgi:hypothetical protein